MNELLPKITIAETLFKYVFLYNVNLFSDIDD